ncbi:hypothetical protein [Mycobacterium xenopi]|uniref:Uncharacterized protein n=1 Tax=Mycobacterium xenopi TaxID=1789 RepID=A0AAD1H405_MYCXE|nr:hypothetical protein [Mycobacterium xenopi]MDA3642277.1 hypothetical protein [Mycobacterium xenopi]MDA3660355.1 hypothetical protein [Mycobacterium xenopi]MDA3664916.1 hypothetical protein [Mycobacterium xenopi]ORX21336.1 hypothetical protein AWC32_01075 [Mycobacterium xenopi]SPX89960.1 Uncharacterised protein [Mycobacterium xenopi]
MVFGELAGGRWYTALVEDLLNFSEHVVAMSRCLDIGLGLAVQYDVGDFADFDRKWVFGALNLLNPRIPILRYCIELAQQLSARVMGGLVRGLYHLIGFPNAAMMLLATIV